MVDYETLMHEHDVLDRLAEKLIAAVMVDAPDSAEILATRDTLAALLTRHLQMEDSAIYPRLIAGDDIAASAAAKAVEIEFEDLTGDFRRHFTNWSPQRIDREWPAFRIETNALMARLRGRIRQENDLLYPLALRASHIQLRASAA